MENLADRRTVSSFGRTRGHDVQIKRMRTGLVTFLKVATICLAAHVVAAPGGYGGRGRGTNTGPVTGVVATATASAEGGLAACGSRAGRELYGCVANVLEKLSADIQNANAPQTQSELTRAASGLRAAVNKAQALLAITQCRSVITTAMNQIAARGGSSQLSLIIGVLARAARLIQSKG